MQVRLTESSTVIVLVLFQSDKTLLAVRVIFQIYFTVTKSLTQMQPPSTPTGDQTICSLPFPFANNLTTALSQAGAQKQADPSALLTTVLCPLESTRVHPLLI